MKVNPLLRFILSVRSENAGVNYATTPLKFSETHSQSTRRNGILYAEKFNEFSLEYPVPVAALKAITDYKPAAALRHSDEFRG